jgi:signal transduction histidine kinase
MLPTDLQKTAPLLGGLDGMPATLAPAEGCNQPIANLAHILAHRMRGPITSIQCYTDLLADELASTEQREMALRIFESAFALEGMLADLQRFTLSLTPVFRPVAPCDVVADLLTALGEEGSRIVFDVRGSDATIQADPLLLRQALLILLRNALDAQGGGGSDEPVRIALHYEADAVHFAVWNAGSLEEGERVFEPFYTTKSGNLGIGLSIARRIAEAHAGQLALSPPSDDGIEFTLRIPIGEELPSLSMRLPEV